MSKTVNNGNKKPLSKKWQKIVTQLDEIERNPDTKCEQPKKFDCIIEMGNAKEWNHDGND